MSKIGDFFQQRPKLTSGLIGFGVGVGIFLPFMGVALIGSVLMSNVAGMGIVLGLIAGFESGRQTRKTLAKIADKKPDFDREAARTGDLLGTLAVGVTLFCAISHFAKVAEKKVEQKQDKIEMQQPVKKADSTKTVKLNG